MGQLRHITTLQATVRFQGYPQANLPLHLGNCIYSLGILRVIGERAKRARHYQGCTNSSWCGIYIYIYLASERSEQDTLRCNAIEISLYLFIYLFIYIVRRTSFFARTSNYVLVKRFYKSCSLNSSTVMW